ncbi:MAG TPA: tetratricopeptide repeat protein [Gemmataceae bacterium]|nr:tetratricopeptide repeat protein [Gemmataceae bacterium]
MLRHARVRLLLVAAVLLAGAGAAAYLYWPSRGSDPERTGHPDESPPDPRLTFDTPFRNVRPDVAYVGDTACAACHRDIDHSFHRHPMGRSAFVMPAPDETGRPDAAGFTAGVADYRVERRDGQMVHVETIRGPDGLPAAVTTLPATVAVGSGTHARTYLGFRGDTLWESGMTWYTGKGAWDLSPSFAPGGHGRRPIGPNCLFCHVDNLDAMPGNINRYRKPWFARQAAIGCERCHGPGALHVQEQTDGRGPVEGVDTSIVNPRHLSAELREDVCRQCHLQGEQRVVRRGRAEFDYRPGLPLDLFLTTFVAHPTLTDHHKLVGHVEQMVVSKCFLGSGGRLGCTSCHDPHLDPAAEARDAFYRERCLACHQRKGCSLPEPQRRPKKDACAACHMPKAPSTGVGHVAVSDHRVPRWPGAPKAVTHTLGAGELPIRLFTGEGRRAPEAAEVDRDLGIALARQWAEKSGDSAQAAAAADRLVAATARHPGDVDAWEALGRLRLGRGEFADARRAAEAVLAVRPDRCTALGLAAEAALGEGSADAAREFARKALEGDPANPQARLRFGIALAAGGAYAEAEVELQAVVTDVPNHPQAHAHLAVCLQHLGRDRVAQTELERAITLDPRRAADLRAWFRDRTR